MEKAHKLEEEAKSQKIEEERKVRMEKLAERQANLEKEHSATQKTLETLEQSGKDNAKIDEFNDSVEILRELKDDAMRKFSQVVDHLEEAVTDGEKEALAKNSVEDLKSMIEKLEVHLDQMGVKGGNMEQAHYMLQAEEVNEVVKKWVEFFHAKTVDADKRGKMKIEYDALVENLNFMKEYGDDEAGNKDLEAMVEQFKTRLDNIKPSRWEQRHVDQMKESMNYLFDAIDDINFDGPVLHDVISKLAWDSNTLLRLE
ncbi:unnamed protein product [Caenorhabditis brenneri]